MIENHPHEAQLIAYADGLATPEEKLRVQELIEHDESAAEFLKQLELTDSWLKEAAAIELDEAPTEISNFVRDYKLPGASIIQAGAQFQPAQRDQPKQHNRMAIAATLFLGIIAGGFLGANFQSATPDYSLSQSDSSLPEWARLVADYHRLYDRVTISDSQPLVANTVAAKLSEKLGRSIAVPDLTAFGMEFKREQSLVYQDKPIIQLVYLPENSRPVAVCILAAKDAAAKEVISGLHEDIQYAYWQDEDHAVIVVGHMPEQQLEAVTKQVAGTLFTAS